RRGGLRRRPPAPPAPRAAGHLARHPRQGPGRGVLRGGRDRLHVPGGDADPAADAVPRLSHLLAHRDVVCAPRRDRARELAHREEYVAWGWAVNGFFSVVSSVLSTVVAMAFGFNAVIVTALALYLIGIAALARIPAPQSPGER